MVTPTEVALDARPTCLRDLANPRSHDLGSLLPGIVDIAVNVALGALIPRATICSGSFAQTLRQRGVCAACAAARSKWGASGENRARTTELHQAREFGGGSRA